MMMTLYHGSTHCVEHPLVALGRKNLDFISTYRAYHKDYSFDLHANPVKEVWNNGRLHLRAIFLSSRQSRESRESLFYYV